MDDSDARCLIDQFNKFASWKTRHAEFQLVPLAAVVAMVGVAVSLAGWLLASIPPTILVVLLLVLGLILIGIHQYRRIERIHEDFEKGLIAPEAYRSEHKSLPDNITFKLVAEKPQDVYKLLTSTREPQR